MSNTVANVTNTLTIDDLRPYAMPDPVGVFPLSGWAWLFVAVLVGALFAWGVLAIMRWRSRAYRRAGLHLLSQLRVSVSDRSADPVGYRVSVILKRVALVAYPREQVATLSGQAWLAFLRSSCPGAVLPDSAGVLLTSPEAAPCSDEDRVRLLTFAADWVKRHLDPRKEQATL